ncbi:protein FAM162A-like [Rattus norvegicus]|uniref:Protein FAM162A n=1 Tax=Rattus norvegicus TaxID=10116 RepID=A0ABK0L942_RAT|nr:protein FAM162A-like [Rattus norvegicus]
MWSLRGLRLEAGHYFRLYERNASSTPRLTRNTDLKMISGFWTKPQESPKAPTQSYRHGVPPHKPTDLEKKILLWSGRFKKEEESPETIRFEMLGAAKNKFWVKVSYLMRAPDSGSLFYMVIEGKKAVKRRVFTSLNLERKACLREEAAMKAKTDEKYLCRLWESQE